MYIGFRRRPTRLQVVSRGLPGHRGVKHPANAAIANAIGVRTGQTASGRSGRGSSGSRTDPETTREQSMSNSKRRAMWVADLNTDAGTSRCLDSGSSVAGWQTRNGACGVLTVQRGLGASSTASRHRGIEAASPSAVDLRIRLRYRYSRTKSFEQQYSL
jgi:hypothetical protein